MKYRREMLQKTLKYSDNGHFYSKTDRWIGHVILDATDCGYANLETHDIYSLEYFP